MGLVWVNDQGVLGSSSPQGDRVFDAGGGLQSVHEHGHTEHVIIHGGVNVDVGGDGLIGWGRWTDGRVDVDGNNGPGSKGHVATLHYVAIAPPPIGAVTAGYTSFGSTAPTATSGSALVAIGTANGATGTAFASVLTVIPGSASYNLTVPVPGQTFYLASTSTHVTGSTFTGVSAISSTGNGCNRGCNGTLGAGNISVIGAIGGTSGERLGLTYGFDSLLGKVSGVIVFKKN